MENNPEEDEKLKSGNILNLWCHLFFENLVGWVVLNKCVNLST